MTNLNSLSENNQNLLSENQEIKIQNLREKKTKHLFIYLFSSVLIFFLGVFSFWFYQKLLNKRSSPTETLFSFKKPQTPKPLPSQNIMPEMETNDFLYSQDNQLWLAKAGQDGKIPTTRKLTDEATDFVLSNSKDKVAFVANGYLKVIDINNNEEITLQKLLPDIYPKEIPTPDYIFAIGKITWMSDDTKLAFVGSNDSQADIYTIDIDGKNLTRLTKDRLVEFSLAWSLDNMKVAFQTAGGFGSGAGFSSSIAVVNNDGTNYSRLVDNGKLPENHNFGPAENLRWINNTEVIFSAWTMSGTDGIWKVDVNTKQVMPVTDKSGRSRPIWSEKNNSFLYPLTEKNLLIIKTTGENNLIETSDEVDWVVWSLDGNKIAYSVRNNPNKPVTKPWELLYDLYVANPDGSNQKKVISNAPYLISNFSFSSDNKMLLLKKRLFEPETHDELWVINTDGENVRKIDSSWSIGKQFTTPHGNLALYSKASSGEGYQTSYYWLNLNNLSEEIFSGNINISQLNFLTN